MKTLLSWCTFTGGEMLFHHCFTQWWRETPTGGNMNCRRQQRFAQQGCKLEPVLQGVQSVISQFNVLILHIFAHPWTYLQQTPKWDLKAYIKYKTNDGGDRSGEAVSAVRHQKSGKLPDNVNKERWRVCVSVCVLPFWAHPDRSQLEGVTRGHNTVINDQCCCYVHRCPVRLFLLDYFHIESDFAVVGGLWFIRWVSFLTSNLIPLWRSHQKHTITLKPVIIMQAGCL